MWKSVLTGLVLENIETLKHYQTMKDKLSNTNENIVLFVAKVIISLPWYFRLPVSIFANIIGVLCIMTTGKMLDVLSSDKRSAFLLRVQFIPFFDMLNKLVRSMAFLKLFDDLAFPPDY